MLTNNKALHDFAGKVRIGFIIVLLFSSNKVGSTVTDSIFGKSSFGYE